LGKLRSRLGVLLDGDGKDVARLDALGKERLGEVDLVAIVGQEDGDLLLIALEAVDG
jgi:hypothetical protein